MSDEPDAALELDPLEPIDEAEEVDALPVLVSEVRTLEPARSSATAIMQTAAVAATGFIAGAATAAVLGRQLGRRIGQRRNGDALERNRPETGEMLDVVSSRTFLVSVHLLGRRDSGAG